MSDDRTNSWPPDRSRISVQEDYERRAWAEYFDASEEELQAAVRAVGRSAERLKEYLKQQRLREYFKRHRRQSRSR